MGIKNKKGIFFIMLTIVILTLFLLSVTFFSGIMVRKSIQKRVNTLSEFVTATEEDLERQLFIFGFRTLYLIQEDVTNTNSPVASIDDIFQEAFFNGTINSQKEDILIDAKFDAIKSNMQQRAKKISANVILSNPSININQDDPWHVKLTFVSNFTVEDKNKLALWNKTLISVSYISIEGFADPLYTIETSGNVILNITKTPYTTFVVSGNPANLISHINNNYYKASASAPSFIDRLEGDYFNNPSPYGIESLVNLPQLQAQGLSVNEKSVVDYIYFDSTSNPSFCIISPSVYPDWFRLDNESNHLANYDVDWVAGCP